MSLDALRKLHAQTVEALMLELARITQQLVQSEQQVEALNARILSDAAVYRQQTEEGLAIEHVLEWHARMDAQQTALKHARQAVGAWTDAWNQTQARLVEASQERKVLDRYAERREHLQRTDAGRREQLALDEAGQRQHASLGKRRG